jgi:hypothetical protein
MPFGPIDIVGAVVVVVGAVVVVVVVVDEPVAPVVVVVDVPEAKLDGATATTKASAMLALNTRDGDGPRLLFTFPPRSRRCIEERS